MIIDKPPFFDLVNGSETPQTDQGVVQAAIANAGGLDGAVAIDRAGAEAHGSAFNHARPERTGYRITWKRFSDGWNPAQGPLESHVGATIEP